MGGLVEPFSELGVGSGGGEGEVSKLKSSHSLQVESLKSTITELKLKVAYTYMGLPEAALDSIRNCVVFMPFDQDGVYTCLPNTIRKELAGKFANFLVEQGTVLAELAPNLWMYRQVYKVPLLKNDDK